MLSRSRGQFGDKFIQFRMRHTPSTTLHWQSEAALMVAARTTNESTNGSQRAPNKDRCAELVYGWTAGCEGNSGLGVSPRARSHP